jgi:AbrB family looped-hinge helix DNA binding protein
MATNVKKTEGGTRRRNQTKVSSKHQVTIPSGAFHGAGLEPGDTLKVEAMGAGRIVLTRLDELLDRSDELHGAADAAIRDLLSSQRLFVSVITYAEVLTGARLGHHSEDHVVGFFADLVSSIVPVDVPIGDCAARLRAQTKALAMPDALIAATAEMNGEVELLVSGDGDVAKTKGLGCPVHLISASGA